MNKNELIKNTVDEILKYMNIRYSLTLNDLGEGSTEADIQGDDLSFLIGYRGESLDGLQAITNQIIFRKTNEWGNAIVDINGYRKQRTDKIISITKNYIDRVRFMQKDVELPTMNAFERRQVHTFVDGYDDITTESIGEGPSRRVVLKLKRK